MSSERISGVAKFLFVWVGPSFQKSIYDWQVVCFLICSVDGLVESCFALRSPCFYVCAFPQ